MGLPNEHVGPIILAKIKIYVLNRAELLFQICYEILCSLENINPQFISVIAIENAIFENKIFENL